MDARLAGERKEGGSTARLSDRAAEPRPVQNPKCGWYAIQVVTGREEETCRLMRRLVSAEALEEVFTPRFATQRKVRGVWEDAESVLFPGYVIAITNQVEALRSQLRGVPEFARLLTMGETFVPLGERDRTWISVLTQAGARTVGMSTAVIEGDRVIVTAGPLVGHEAWIASVNRHKSIAILEVEMFGRKLKTKVGLAIVARRSKDE